MSDNQSSQSSYYFTEDPVISAEDIDNIMAYCYPHEYNQKKKNNKQSNKMDFDYNEEMQTPPIPTYDLLDWRKKAENYRKECDGLKALIAKINEENQSLREQVQELKEELRDLSALLD